ncbi:unnamed protein product, partial [Ectocarpus sp. 12 AP-2014]
MDAVAALRFDGEGSTVSVVTDMEGHLPVYIRRPLKTHVEETEEDKKCGRCGPRPSLVCMRTLSARSSTPANQFLFEYPLGKAAWGDRFTGKVRIYALDVCRTNDGGLLNDSLVDLYLRSSMSSCRRSSWSKGVFGVPRGDAGESTRDTGGGAASNGCCKSLGPGGVAWRRNARGGGVAVRDDVDEGCSSGGAPAAVAPAGDADDATTAVASIGSTPRAAGSIDASK